MWAPPKPDDDSTPDSNPTCKLLTAGMPEPSTAAPAAWLAYFAAGGCVIAPPEAPTSSNVAKTGDVDRLPVNAPSSGEGAGIDARTVYRALFLEEDPGTLLILADSVEVAGYLFAANRLRKKAFRNIT